MTFEREIELPVTFPEFDRPPVVELVIGAQFELLSSFQSAHLGAMWKKLWPDWSTALSDPIESILEQFDDPISEKQQLLTNAMVSIGDKRVLLRLRNHQEDRMIQIQNGRLHYNWLRRDEAAYPRFGHILPEFFEVLGLVRTYLASEGIGQLVPNQWEVTYVNRIPQGELWTTPADWPAIFSSPPVPAPKHSLIELESLDCTWHYRIPSKRGRLHAELRHGNAIDLTELLLLNLTARGPMPSQTEDGLRIGLETGHKVIVQSFYELTSPRAHDYWGVKR